MNYNALLLLDKHHKQKKDYSSSVLNIHQYALNKEKYNKYINIRTKNKQKFHSTEKYYSVKPSIYTIPKDINLKDIFQQEKKTYKDKIRLYSYYHVNDDTNENRKQIFSKIKKIIEDKRVNFDIYIKTIYLYDLICIKKEYVESEFKDKFKSTPNILIALTAFILIMKFNYVESKMTRLKKILEYFGDIDIHLKDIYEMEIFILKLIDYELSFQTPLSYLELLLINGIVFSEDYLQSDSSFNIYELAKESLENIMEKSNEYFKYDYFYLSCSIISFVRDKAKINKWPKALEFNFGTKFEEFYDVYKIFFQKNNEKVENSKFTRSKERNFHNSDIINIKNLKNINNIINVLKIIKSPDKHKKVKEKTNKNDFKINFSNERKNENQHQYTNNDIATSSSPLNKIKVGLKKNWNVSSYKFNEKANISKSQLSSMISKVNEEKINKVSVLYMKRNDQNISENKNNKNNNKENEKIKNNLSSSFSNDISEKDEINELETMNKFSLAKSYNKYKRIINIRDRNEHLDNKSFINSYKPNLDYSLSTYQRNTLINKISKNKEIKDKNNKSNINNYDYLNVNLNNFSSSRRKYKYFNKNTEKKINKEILNKEKQNFNSNKNSSTLTQTSFCEFNFYKHKPNIKKEILENDNTFSKIKEENSDIPTCESSDPKLSLNDFSIRKTYRSKKFKKDNEDKNIEKDSKKDIVKTNNYNKIINIKISTDGNPLSRKIGVRKFYKQKNLEENK